MRIGSSWGYMHAGTIHSPVCTSCKTNSQNGDPCPICAEDIEAILQVMTQLETAQDFLIKLDIKPIMYLESKHE